MFQAHCHVQTQLNFVMLSKMKDIAEGNAWRGEPAQVRNANVYQGGAAWIAENESM